MSTPSLHVSQISGFHENFDYLHGEGIASRSANVPQNTVRLADTCGGAGLERFFLHRKLECQSTYMLSSLNL